MAKKPAGEDGGGGAVESAAVVLATGPERFLMLEAAEKVRAALTKREGGEVATFVFDGASCQAAEVLDELRTLGLMAPAKIVIVENAEQMLKEKDDEEEGGGAAAPGVRGFGRKSAREMMTEYAASPERASVLLLRAGGKWNKGKLDAAIIDGGGVIIDCQPPGPAEAERWCVSRAAKHKTTLEPAAAKALVENIGCELGRLDSELEKLAIAASSKGESKVNAALVGEMVGFSREEESIFALQRYLLGGDAETALRQVRQMIEVSRQTPAALMVAVVDLARKVDGAARGFAARESEGAISGRLRLWGASAGPILSAGRRVKPVHTAALLAAAVDGEHRIKSGRGEPEHIVEGLVLRFVELAGSPVGAAR
jgi:DNA polymerase III delta subunit